jgi:ATP-dependent Clp protease adaptor protein ClpS
MSQEYEDDDHHGGSGVALQPAKPKLKQPPLYKVLILNDDYTPMEFVVEVLQVFFKHSQEKAVQIMLSIHQTGQGVAGIYPFEIAETKVQLVNDHSRQSQHPLLTILEKA